VRISDVETYVLGTAWRNLTHVGLHTEEALVGDPPVLRWAH
jgi:hypothetical protein